MQEYQRIIRHLRTEINALDRRLGERNRLVTELRTQLTAMESNLRDERRTHIYQRAARNLVEHQVAEQDPAHFHDDTELLGQTLVMVSDRLDHTFAEVRALAEVTERINAGMFLDEVLNHVFEVFERIIPYDRIGFALIEKDKQGRRFAVAHWARAKYEHLVITNNFRAPLEDSSLGEIEKSKRPRILNDLSTYLAEHPNSASTRLILREGIQSSLTCPLVIKDVVTGFIFFSSCSPGTYEEAHVELFLQIAGELAITVEKGKVYQELYARNQFIRKVFGQYVADEIAEMLLNDEQALQLGGERCEVTILICDLRRFTPMSERMKPEEVVNSLNNFLGAMTSVIMKHGGTVDNLIGDAILAVFGIPVAKPDDSARAVACAIEMQNTMLSVNEKNAEQGYPALAMGIGLNTGEVIVGNIGSESRMQYSVIGSPVNLAARIESFTSDGQILAAQSTIEQVRKDVQLSGNLRVKVKGIDRPVPIYDVTGIAGEFNLFLEEGLQQPC